MLPFFRRKLKVEDLFELFLPELLTTRLTRYSLRTTKRIWELSERRRLAWEIGLLLVVLGGDYLTGPDVNFTLLYVLPVAVATWYTGLSAGVAFAVISSAGGLTTDYLTREHQPMFLVYLWNFGMKLLVLLIFVSLLATLKRRLARERVMARTDPLTGTGNRRAYYEAVEAALFSARAQSLPLTLAYIDLDKFKEVNDRFGHDIGDLLLQTVGSALKRAVRESDFVARLGGDEFCLVLPGTGKEAAGEMLRRLREILLQEMNSLLPSTASIGAVTFLLPPKAAEHALKKADEVLYEVKASGRNHLKLAVVENL